MTIWNYDVLFDSQRSYLDQLEYYHLHRNGGT
jgi:hypothetical protein